MELKLQSILFPDKEEYTDYEKAYQDRTDIAKVSD